MGPISKVCPLAQTSSYATVYTYSLLYNTQEHNEVTWRPHVRNEVTWRPMFEVFRKQMYCIEESTCDIVGTFRRPPRAVASGGASGARTPHLKSVPPHFTFGPLVAAYIQYCILKMWSPLLVLAPPSGFWPPLLLNPGDGPAPTAVVWRPHSDSAPGKLLPSLPPSLRPWRYYNVSLLAGFFEGKY